MFSGACINSFLVSLLLITDIPVLDCSAPLILMVCLCISAVGVHIVLATQSHNVRVSQICGTVLHAEQAEHGIYGRRSASSATLAHFLQGSHKIAIFVATECQMRRDQRVNRA